MERIMKMMRAVVATTVLLLAQHASGQCLGDFNGDGMVTINEIIIAVNNSLNGCQDVGPTPTPTPMAGVCPIDFSSDNSQQGTPDCFYMGSWNATCGANDLQTRWISFLHNPTDPTSVDIVVVQLLGFNPPLYYGAGTTSPNTAELIGWYRMADASDLQSAPGSLTLGPSGATLELIPDAAPFQVDMCPFAHYNGALIDVSQSAAAPAAVLREQIDSGALARLRAARAAHAERPNFDRE
jgi:hypothetical protein